MTDRIRVTTISRKGVSTLVQYVDDGAVNRKYVPSKSIVENSVDTEVLRQGIPYGYPWREINIVFDTQRFENELHNVDIWTTVDALKFPQKVWSALRATLSENIKEILTIASSEKKRGR